MLFASCPYCNFETIRISHRGSFINIITAKVVYCRAGRNSASIFFNDGSCFTHTKPLTTLEELLQDSLYFLRSHRSYIINMAYLLHASRENGVILYGKIKLPLPLKRVEAMEARIDELRLAGKCLAHFGHS